jgi:hypothetical protein
MSRAPLIFAATAFLAAALPAVAPAAVDPGDILVADQSASAGNTGAVIAVNPATGEQEVVSDNTINTGTDLFVDPLGIALEASGSILVADISAGPANTGAVIRVNPTTGQQTLVSDNNVNTGADLFDEPMAIALESDGSILVADNTALTADSVIRVNPSTGQQTLVSSNAVNAGTDLFSQLSGIAVEPGGQILVSDLDSLTPHFGGGAVIRVDPITGQQAVVSSNNVNTGTDLFSEVWGVTLNAAGEIIATDSDTSLTGAVIGIDGTGQQTAISNNAINTGADLFDQPLRSRVDAAGDIIVVDQASDLLRVNPATGQQSSIATGGNMISPSDLVVVPGGFVPPPPPPPPPPPGSGGPNATAATPAQQSTAKRCRKGQKLKKGRCVKKRKRKKK